MLAADVGGMGGAHGGHHGGGQRPRQNVVNLTQEEMDAIKRLMDLGFDQ